MLYSFGKALIRFVPTMSPAALRICTSKNWPSINDGWPPNTPLAAPRSMAGKGADGIQTRSEV